MRMRHHSFSTIAAIAAILALTPALRGGDLDDSIAKLKAVQADGAGNAEAAAAYNDIVAAGPQQITKLLEAMDGAGPLGANWLRGAAEAIAIDSIEKKTLPASDLERFALDVSHDPRGRRLAYEWVASVDPSAADRIVPKLLNDPSVEFRRDAVQRLMDRGEKLFADDKQAAGDIYMEAIGAARDEDQIKAIVEQLKKLERPVDLQRHFGFLVDWHVIGPFDNTGRAGFEKEFPPEKELDLQAEYAGKNGPVKWQPLHTSDDYGIVDFNQPYTPLKETTGYAWTHFESPAEREAQLRLGCKNAWKIWLNGELVFGRDEYHRGMSLDQYILPVKLKAGRNEILVKACQNEETQTWTTEWQFQLRVCDAAGTAILSADRAASPRE